MLEKERCRCFSTVHGFVRARWEADGLLKHIPCSQERYEKTWRVSDHGA